MTTPRRTDQDMTGYTDYAVMVRTAPTAAWTHAWAYPPASSTLEEAQGSLAYFQRLSRDEVADARQRVTTAKTDKKRAKREGYVQALERIEFQIFERQISPYLPLTH